MKLNHIYNESCLDTMKRFKHKVSLILTSPPYNTSYGNDITHKRYKYYDDTLSYEDYLDFTLKVFKGYDRVLKRNGVILYNISYAQYRADELFRLINKIIVKTNFSIADVIIWKKEKSRTMPNVSRQCLTRICEFVFVFVRKDEIKSFNCNKKVICKGKSDAPIYDNVLNFIEAENKDASAYANKLNTATFSKQLVNKLLNIYYVKGIVYDSFMGIGTTAKACLLRGINFIGSEIDKEQIEYFKEWKKKQLNTTF